MSTVTETAAGSPVEEAVPTITPATAMPVETTARAVNIEAIELEEIVPTETAVEPPVEEAAVLASAEPVVSAPPATHATEAATVAPAEAPANPPPVEVVRTIARPVESAGAPETKPAQGPTAAGVPDAEEVTVAEAFTHPPLEETKPASPQRVASAPAAADSIETVKVARVENTVDSAPPASDLEIAEHVQPAGDRPAQRVDSAETSVPGAETATGTAVAAKSSGEGDTGRSTTPATGSGARTETVGNPAAHHGYLRKVLERIGRFKRYPREAKRDGVVGKVMVRFTVLADGSVQSPQLTGTSGDSRLDQAALEMLSRASPFPPIPRSLGTGKLELSLPVQFSLKRKKSLFRAATPFTTRPGFVRPAGCRLPPRRNPSRVVKTGRDAASAGCRPSRGGRPPWTLDRQPASGRVHAHSGGLTGPGRHGSAALPETISPTMDSGVSSASPRTVDVYSRRSLRAARTPRCTRSSSPPRSRPPIVSASRSSSRSSPT